MKHSYYHACLAIDRLSLAVRLGITEEERQRPQPVEVSMRLYFPALPPGCLDDNAPFLCYDKLCTAAGKPALEKPFRLLENLTYAIFQEVRAAILAGWDEGDHVKLWIRAVKCNAPVPSLRGGTCFVYSDLPEGVGAVPVE